MRELINTRIKFREKFRPFAPAVAEEALDEFFEDAVPDPFMLQVYPIREAKRAVIPAAAELRDPELSAMTVQRAETISDAIDICFG